MNFAEREVYDLFGIDVRRPSRPHPHPHARRLGRPPAAQGRRARARARHLQGRPEPAMSEHDDRRADERRRRRRRVATTRSGSSAQTDEGAQELRPTARTRELVLTGGPWPEDDDDDTMIINMGPQHPSTHGVLRHHDGARRRDRAPRQAGDRLPPHRHGEDRRGAHLRAGRAPTSRAWTTRRRCRTSSSTRWRSSGCSTSRCRRARDVDPHDARRAQPHVVAPAVPGHERHGHRRGLDDDLRLARARRGAAAARDASPACG